MNASFARMGLLAAAGIAAVGSNAGAAPAKNVIYMIADGAGFNTYAATGYYNGNFGSELVRGEGWQGFAMSTYPLRTGTTPIAGAAGLEQDPNTVYASNKQWDVTPTSGSLEFAGYQWTSSTAPDSANTISSSMTGVKTYNNAVNVNGNGTALPTFAQLAHQQRGMRTGIVTTVQWPDATPSAFSGISNPNRGNRTAIANQMLNAPYIDVIMGAGNPDYDNDGAARATPDHTWIGNDTWNDLKDGDATGLSSTWQLIQDKAEFDNLASGTLVPAPGKKLVGVVKSFDGKQQYRSSDGGLTTNYTTLPGVNLRTDVPHLSTMVQGALKVLPENGFFLGIEQGEVDRAMHSNHLGRMIEAQIEFNETVAYIDSLLNANAGNPDLPNYENTLLIVTADHDHLLLGPNSDTVPFDAVTNNGLGALPGALFQTGSHSNTPVPIFAKGAGSDLLAFYADQTDIFDTGALRTVFGHGPYLDQAELFHVFLGATGTVPEPASIGVMCLAGAGIGLRRRRAAGRD